MSSCSFGCPQSKLQIPIFREKSLLRFQQPKRHSGASRALLLLVACSIGATVQLPQALAQPAVAKTDKPKFKPLPAETRTEIQKAFLFVQREDICKTPFDLKVKDATLEDVAAQVKAAFPNTPLIIKVRDARPVKLSFELPGTKTGDALQQVSALGGCELFLFPDYLLLAPADKLNEQEQSDLKNSKGWSWKKSRFAAGAPSQWNPGVNGLVETHTGRTTEDVVKPALVRAIYQSVQDNAAPMKQSPTRATPDTKTNPNLTLTFGDLSPEAQGMVQQIVNWQCAQALEMNPDIPRLFNTQLTADALVDINTSKPKEIVVTIRPGASEHPGPTRPGFLSLGAKSP